MIFITDILEIADYYDFDAEFEGINDEDSYVNLKYAIECDRVFIDDDTSKLCLKLTTSAKFFDKTEPESDVAKFRRVTGGDKRMLMNLGGKKGAWGDAAFKLITRLCNITNNSLEELSSKDVAIMEDISQLFL